MNDGIKKRPRNLAAMFQSPEARVADALQSSLRELGVAGAAGGARMLFGVRPHSDGKWVAAALTLSPEPSEIVSVLLETSLGIADVERLRAVLQKQCGRFEKGAPAAAVVEGIRRCPVRDSAKPQQVELALQLFGA
jgi:hypothetical protein